LRSFIINFFKKGSARTLRAKKNITVSFISKGVSILISFLIVPLTLSYVGKVEYGIWMTLSSIIHWFAFFDVGLGNGLRNKLAEALALDDTKQAKIYVSSAFAIISGISLMMLAGFYITAHYVSWNKILNTEAISNSTLLNVVLVVFFFFCLDFVFKLLSSILRAQQRYAYTDIINIVAQLAGLIAIFVLVKTTEGSLLNLCLIYAGKAPVVTFIAGLFLFTGSLKHLRPSFRYIQLRQALPLINLGVKFFISQIFYLIITQSSVILIVQFFCLEDVTVFNLAKRYMTIGTMLYMMVLTPFLTAFTEAYTKKDYVWIRSIIKQLNTIWLLLCVGTIILVLAYRLFFKLWVGDEIVVPFSLILALATSGILHTFYNKYTLFLNGVGLIKLQLYILGGQAMLFIPLSYLFYKLQFGLSSVVISQIILYIPAAVIFYKQYHKVINEKATGIWAK